MPDSKKIFEEEYKNLNKAQKEAVDTIDGPVMVVAGPGTGKTQILALRIANILHKTDIKADGILALTFTNSAVGAMRERLTRYIGKAGEEVNVYTFHSFGMKIVEEFFPILGLRERPKLMEETDRAILFEEILLNNDWEYLRPRGSAMRYFENLKSLISLLKRERITAQDFEKAIKKEIKNIESDEENISTRGESKGELKKEILKELEGLDRTMEVVKFINLYEKAKKDRNLFDYDDVLENLVKIVEDSKEALSSIRERYLYVLVDEHQDSSRVQNEFLAHTWAEVEKPDIFVVGDDRQLIYGFSGASIEHFAGFHKTFKGAKLITLIDNYRSTQVILDAAHALLPSVMSDKKLVSQSKDKHPIRLVEAENEEDEIITAGEDIKEKIKEGIKPSDCAVLVPKNAQARRALRLFYDMGVSVSIDETMNLFDDEGAQALLRVLKIIDSGDKISLALSFFDKVSGLSPLEAHKFLVSQYMREFSLDNLSSKNKNLFSGGVGDKWIEKLLKLRSSKENDDLKSLITLVGKELFVKDNKDLVSGEEITNTILGLLARREENNPNLTLSQFVNYLEKIESYGEFVPIVGAKKEGVKVLTMHGSKGLEFDYVWIAHMDERSLSGGRKSGFTLLESISERVEEGDINAIKRKLYVAITRAKRFCTLSYSITTKSESERELAKIIADLPDKVFKKEKAKNIKNIKSKEKSNILELAKLVSLKYKDRYISASLLNNFFECPWKWYFCNLLQLPEPENEHFIFGNKIHAAIDQILKRNVALSEKEILNIVNDDQEAAALVLKWAKARFADISKDRDSEHSVSFKDKQFPHLKIYGRMDLIEKLADKNLRVTDFKTGSAKRKSEIIKLDEEGRQSNLMRQLAMYSYLLENSPKWRGIDVGESRLEFLEALPAQAGKNSADYFYDTVIQKEQIDLLIKDIRDYDDLIKKGEWVDRPCNYNSYGKNTECEYCKMAEIYK